MRGRVVWLLLAAVAIAILMPALSMAYLSTGPAADPAWYWHQPVPQGNDLRAMSWSGTNDAWAVGVSGTVLRSTDAGLTWVTQDAGTTRDLTGVSFSGTTRGWIVGLAGTIIATTDGGATWTSQTSGTSANLRAVSFFDETFGIAVGDASGGVSTIRYTNDGGVTWRTGTTASTVGLTSVHMVSATTGWAVGGSGVLLRTTDGGATWTVRTSPTTAGLNSISFEPNGVVGYMVGNAVLPNWTIYRTTNSGGSWTAITGLGATGALNLFGVHALDTNNAVVAGANGSLWRTTNGGGAWTNRSQNNIGPNALRAVRLTSTTSGYAIGDVGTMFYTRNSGDTWYSLMPSSLARIQATSFFDSSHGWAVGQNGAIMRTADAGQTWEHQAGGVSTWRAVHFVSATTGWLAGDGGVIKRTTNGTTWTSQTSGTTQQLNGLWFTTANTGFAVGNNGTILRTTNSGGRWRTRTSGTTRSLNAVWFANTTTGYAVGANGTIRKTTDGGTSWTTSTSGTTQTLLTVRGVSANVVWAAGSNGTLLKTTNGGATWTALSPGVGTSAIRSLFFTDANTGWIGADFGTVRKTTDGGANWVSQNAALPTSATDPSTAVNAMWFANSSLGYLFGDSNIARRTIDGGTNWFSVQYGTWNSLNSVVSPDGVSGWAVGGLGVVMHTANGGQSWAQQKSGATTSLNGVWMVDALRGWAVGDTGTIRRTDDGGRTWVAQTSGTTANLISIAADDDQNAVLAGNGVVKFTSNGGTTWTDAAAPPTEPVTGLYMVGTGEVWATATRVSGNNVIWYSADGGDTWTAQSTTANANLWDVYFRDASVGYAVGDSGVILKTEDGGANWVRKVTPTTLPFYAIRFEDANTGWAVGGGGVTARTVDGGETWTLRPSGTSRALNSIAVSGSGTAWAVGSLGTILQNNDVAPPITTLAIDPAAPNGTNGWYAGTLPAITLSTGGTTTYYGWDSAVGPFSTYGAPFSSIEGTQTLFYYSEDALGNAEVVNTYAISSDVSSPTVPSGLATSYVATSSATVTWTPSSDVISGVSAYDVYLDGTYVASTEASVTQATLVGLSPSTMYSVRVQAVDIAGNVSLMSGPLSFMTNAVTTTPYVTVLGADPLVPDGLSDWYVTTPTVTLASLPMSGGPRTTYYSWVSALGPYSSYTTTLTAGAGEATLYYSTHDDLAVRSDEPTQSRLFKVDTQTPATPSVTATQTSYQSIVATWPAVPDTPSGIAHYSVYLDGSFYSWVTTNTVSISGLASSTTFDLTVSASNNAGTVSSMSTTVTATTPAPPKPPAPANLLAKAPSGDTAYLNWTASSSVVGAVNYHVWRSLDGISYSVVATTTGGVNDTAYIDRGLASSTRYWYAVSAIDDRGESSFTSTAAATWAYTAPTTTRPDRILGVTATGGDGSVYLSWQPSSDPAVIGYVVRRATASMSAMTTITPFPGGPPGDPILSATAYFDLTAENGQTYYYQVAEVNDKLVIGLPSVDVEAKPVAPYPANQPHPHYYGNESACICHATHSSTTLRPLVRFPKADQNTMCKTCHSPVVSFAEFVDPLLKSKHPQGATVTPSEPYSCVTCHSPLVADGTPLNNLMRTNQNTPCVVVTDTPAGNGFCYSCHGTGSTLPMGDLTVFETSGHSTALDPPATGANITCDVCHESHSSRNTRLLKYEGFMVCVQCHTSSATNPNQVDILGKLMLNEGANTKHPILPQDQVTGARMTCQNCHNTHTTTKDYPLVDPHNPGPTGTWTTPRSDEKAFCFTCHDGNPLPTSVETSPWAEPVLARGGLTVTSNIQAAYSVNTHGFASRSGATTTTAHLRPDMGYAYGDVLECRSCHDPHGTANNDAVLDTVRSADGSKIIYGVLTYKIPSGGKDFRFFCQTCHIWDSASHDARAGTSTTTFPTNCKACHGHTAGTVPGLDF